MVNFNGVNGAKGLPFGEGSRSDGIKKQETSQPSIFEGALHTNDIDRDKILTAEEMGIKDKLKTLQEQLLNNSRTTEGGQRLSILRMIIDKLGEGIKYDENKISDASDEMNKRINDVNLLLNAIKGDNINDKTINSLKSNAAGAIIYENIEVNKEFDKVKPEVEEIIKGLEEKICDAIKTAIATNQAIDYSGIPVERHPEGFVLALGNTKAQKGIDKQEGVENDMRSKDGKHILRYIDGGRLTINYTIKHKLTGQIITGEYKLDLGKDFYGENNFKKEESDFSIEISDDVIELE